MSWPRGYVRDQLGHSSIQIKIGTPAFPATRSPTPTDFMGRYAARLSDHVLASWIRARSTRPQLDSDQDRNASLSCDPIPHADRLHGAVRCTPFGPCLGLVDTCAINSATARFRSRSERQPFLRPDPPRRPTSWGGTLHAFRTMSWPRGYVRDQLGHSSIQI